MSTFLYILPDGSLGFVVSPVEVEPGQTDHLTAAFNRIPQQFRDKQNFIKLVNVLATPAVDLEQALWDLYTKRGIYDSEGAQLDMLGGIVGQERNGQDDDTYRIYLLARIATNKSHGRFSDLITITRLILDHTDGTVRTQTVGIAAVTVQITGVIVLAALADVLVSFLRLAVKGGVQLYLETSEALESDSFMMASRVFLTGVHAIGSTKLTVDSGVSEFPTSGYITIEQDVPADDETFLYIKDPVTPNTLILTGSTAIAHTTGDDVTLTDSLGNPLGGKGWGSDVNPALGGQYASALI